MPWGAVTGTVLTFEFGLLWPRFMGQWGAAFGVPFAFEGLFFFTEAIFISLYIFGWQRLKPWTHFWLGVPIPIAGIFGAISVVSANAWMNTPTGFTLDASGKIVDGLTSRALVLVIISVVSGVAALWLIARTPRRGGRLAAVTAVGALVLAWGVAQWDYILPETLTVSAAAAPSGTIKAVLVVAVLALILIVPSFTMLYLLDQKSILQEEGVPD